MIFVLSLLFFLLSCSKDDDSEPLDPTEAVELTVKFQFQYFSSDISLSEVSANLKYLQSSSMIIESVSSNVSGQPGEYKLVLSVRGVEAENLINE